jgi:hypothetical protein
MELRRPTEYFSRLASTRIGWMLPSCPRPKLGFRVFACPGDRAGLKASAVILSWTYALLQSPPGIEPPPLRRTPEGGLLRRDSSHEVCLPYSVSPLGTAA